MHFPKFRQLWLPIAIVLAILVVIFVKQDTSQPVPVEEMSLPRALSSDLSLAESTAALGIPPKERLQRQLRSVVALKFEEVRIDENGNESARAYQGTGFFIDNRKCLILTNEHITENARNFKVTMLESITEHGFATSTTIANIVYEPLARSHGDSAVLKANNCNGAIWAPIHSHHKPHYEEPVTMIGGPSSSWWTLSHGYISQPARSNREYTGSGWRMLQVDISGAKGSSGSPVFDKHGRVIGQLHSTDGSTGDLKVASPAGLLWQYLDKVAIYGHMPELSFDIGYVKNLTKNEALLHDAPYVKQGFYGVQLTKYFDKDAPVKQGDVLVKIGDQPIFDRLHLKRLALNHEEGETVSAMLIDNITNTPYTANLNVVTKERPDPQLWPETQSWSVNLGLQLASNSERFGIDLPVIVAMDPDGMAAKSGLFPGMVASSEITQKRLYISSLEDEDGTKTVKRVRGYAITRINTPHVTLDMYENPDPEKALNTIKQALDQGLPVSLVTQWFIYKETTHVRLPNTTLAPWQERVIAKARNNEAQPLQGGSRKHIIQPQTISD